MDAHLGNGTDFDREPTPTGAEVASAIMAGAREWLDLMARGADEIAFARSFASKSTPARYALKLVETHGSVTAARAMLDEIEARVGNATDDAPDCREEAARLAAGDQRFHDSRRGGGE